MPRKSPGHDSRMITYRTLPGSSTPYQRVNVGECTVWVQTNLLCETSIIPLHNCRKKFFISL